jgi:hypothetical protein
LTYRDYHEESNTNKPVAKFGDAREEVSSPKKNKISALEAFKTGITQAMHSNKILLIHSF